MTSPDAFAQLMVMCVPYLFLSFHSLLFGDLT